MDAEEFIKLYEIALGTQDWKAVEPLISSKASVTFSDGTVHHEKAKVREAFERNFSLIKNEKYVIHSIKWLIKDERYAVYLFEFEWTGIVKGNSIYGSGRGTAVIRNEEGNWRLITEHLGRKQS